MTLLISAVVFVVVMLAVVAAGLPWIRRAE